MLGLLRVSGWILKRLGVWSGQKLKLDKNLGKSLKMGKEGVGDLGMKRPGNGSGGW